MSFWAMKSDVIPSKVGAATESKDLRLLFAYSAQYESGCFKACPELVEGPDFEIEESRTIKTPLKTQEV